MENAVCLPNPVSYSFFRDQGNTRLLSTLQLGKAMCYFLPMECKQKWSDEYSF